MDPPQTEMREQEALERGSHATYECIRKARVNLLGIGLLAAALLVYVGRNSIDLSVGQPW